MRFLMKEKYVINKLGLKGILNRPWDVFSTSAVTLDGLLDVFKWIYEQTSGEKLEFIVDKKKEEDHSFHFPCPMKKEFENGTTFCLNRDEFIETEATNFGFHDEVNKMVLKILPDLRKEAIENSGNEICPDFCIKKNREEILRCPVTKYQIETRGIKVTLKRYEDSLVLSQIYGAKIGEDLCRECIYKIIISPDTLLSEDDLRQLTKSFK